MVVPVSFQPAYRALVKESKRQAKEGVGSVKPLKKVSFPPWEKSREPERFLERRGRKLDLRV
jgi:hypothetical protein